MTDPIAIQHGRELAKNLRRIARRKRRLGNERGAVAQEWIAAVLDVVADEAETKAEVTR